MALSRFVTTAIAASTLASVASAFDAQAKTNVAVYYGQGYNQPRLSHFCQETSLDIINLGFVNVFPDQGLLGLPGSNFGNQCDGLTLSIGNASSEFLTGCPQLAEDIPICQAAGKKVLLSLGGDSTSNQIIESQASAINFADFLWATFGPKSDKLTLLENSRPLGDAVVDGFDFDIEKNGGYGYATMVNRLREHFAEEPFRTFYISGAPQCPIPDAQLGDAIANSAFDFVWVQFYNTEGCSARNFIEGNGNPGFNYDDWVTVIKNSANPKAKLLVGLPASPEMAIDGFYLKPDEVEPLVAKYMDMYPESFGGIMLWEASASDRNQVNGQSYAANMKGILNNYGPAPVSTPIAIASPSSSTIPVHSTTAISGLPSSSSTPTTPKPSSDATRSPSRIVSTPSSSVLITLTTTPAQSSTSVSSASVSTETSHSLITPNKPTSSSSVLLTTSSTATISQRPSSSLSPSPEVSIPGSKHTVSTGVSQTASKTSSTTLATTNSTPLFGSGSWSTGATSTDGVDRPTLTSGTMSATESPSSIITGSSVKPSTVTTVVVTSYTAICPTGFTTITTTFTTTYCPETVSAPSTTPASSLPTNWNTAVTVCTHCAPPPTSTSTAPENETNPPKLSDTAPGGRSKSLSSHKTSVKTSPGTPLAAVTPVHTPSSRVIGTGTGVIRPSSTFHLRPTESTSRGPVAPSGIQEMAPMFTGSATKSGLGNGFAMVMALVLSVMVVFL